MTSSSKHTALDRNSAANAFGRYKSVIRPEMTVGFPTIAFACWWQGDFATEIGWHIDSLACPPECHGVAVRGAQPTSQDFEGKAG